MKDIVYQFVILTPTQLAFLLSLFKFTLQNIKPTSITCEYTVHWMSITVSDGYSEQERALYGHK